MAGVEIKIGADPSHFHSALDSMRHKAAHFGAEMGQLSGKIAAGFGLERVIEHVLEGINEATSAYKEFAVNVEQTTMLLGENAEEVQRVGYAAKIANADFGELQKGILKLRATQAEAAKGSPDAKEVFANLEMNPEEFGAAKLTEQVLMLAAAFEKLSEKGDPVNLFLNALGTKNRALIPMLAQGREALEHHLTEAPITSDYALEHEKAAREKRVEHEATLRSKIGDSGIIDAQDKMHEVTSGIGGSIAEAGNWLYDRAIKVSRVLGTDGGERTSEERKDDASRKAITKVLGSDVHDFGPRRTIGGDPPSVLPETTHESESEHGAAHGTGHGHARETGHKKPIATAWANSSEREASAEKIREADFRNDQLLQPDLQAHADALKSEQSRIFKSSIAETDPKKKLELLLKGKGMESEIVGTMKELQKPDSLHISASKIAEMGGGGPAAVFGGVELKIDTSNSILREIRDRLGGRGGGIGWNAETGQVMEKSGTGGIAGMAETITRMLPSVESFPEKR